MSVSVPVSKFIQSILKVIHIQTTTADKWEEELKREDPDEQEAEKLLAKNKLTK